MAWPRPTYPGDFIVAKFYDVPPGESIVRVQDTSTLLTRMIVPPDVLVPNHLYQIWFGPFSYASKNLGEVTQPHTVMDVGVFYKASVNTPRVPVGRSIQLQVPNVGMPRGRSSIPMLHAFFTPQDSTACMFEVRAITILGETNVNEISIDLTLFGISAVSEPQSYNTVNTLP